MDKINDYYAKITNAIEDNNIDTAILNIRYLVEYMTKAYAKAYVPDIIYDDTYSKIVILTEKGIISESSANIYHALRKLCNKTAHEGESVLIDEAREAIAPLKRLINEYNNIINNPQTSFEQSNDNPYYITVSEEAYQLLLKNDFNNARDLFVKAKNAKDDFVLANFGLAVCDYYLNFNDTSMLGNEDGINDYFSKLPYTAMLLEKNYNEHIFSDEYLLNIVDFIVHISIAICEDYNSLRKKLLAVPFQGYFGRYFNYLKRNNVSFSCEALMVDFADNLNEKLGDSLPEIRSYLCKIWEYSAIQFSKNVSKRTNQLYAYLDHCNEQLGKYSNGCLNKKVKTSKAIKIRYYSIFGGLFVFGLIIVVSILMSDVISDNKMKSIETNLVEYNDGKLLEEMKVSGEAELREKIEKIGSSGVYNESGVQSYTLDSVEYIATAQSTVITDTYYLIYKVGFTVVLKKDSEEISQTVYRVVKAYDITSSGGYDLGANYDVGSTNHFRGAESVDAVLEEISDSTHTEVKIIDE